MKKNLEDQTMKTDVEQAWDRFRQTVAGEPAPGFWKETESNEPETAQLQNQLSPSGTDSSSDVHSDQALAGKTPLLNSPVLRTSRRHSKWKKVLYPATAAVLAGILLFSPWGEKSMASMLQTFRINHFQVISVNESDLMGLQDAIMKGSLELQSFDLNRYGQVEQQGGGPSRTISIDEARQLAGKSFKLPSLGAKETLQLNYQPGQELTFHLNTGEINKLIGTLGGKSKLPSSVDGKPVTIRIPASLEATASSTGDGLSSYKTLAMMEVPTLDVPPGVDVEQVRKAVLDLPLLPASLKSRLAGISDWTHTLPIPSMNGSLRQMTIEGKDAVLNETEYARTLMWLQDGHVYNLNGPNTLYGSTNAIVSEAKGIMGQ